MTVILNSRTPSSPNCFSSHCIFLSATQAPQGGGLLCRHSAGFPSLTLRRVCSKRYAEDKSILHRSGRNFTTETVPETGQQLVRAHKLTGRDFEIRKVWPKGSCKLYQKTVASQAQVNSNTERCGKSPKRE